MKYSIRPIAFRPEWVSELGDMQTVVYFQQIYYWSDKGKLDDGWVFKTIDEFEYETTLSKEQQKRCRERLIRLGYIEVKKEKAKFGKSLGSPVLHFKWLKIPLAGNPTMESSETRQSNSVKHTNPLYTKNTTKSTTKIHLQTKVCEETFSQEEYIQSMLENKSKHIQLIGWYFKKKRLFFPDKKTITAEVRRWMASSAFIARYEEEKLLKTIEFVEKKFPDDWNLSTIRKYIPEI